MANSGLKRMCNFSLVQSMQISVTGLNVGMFVFKNFQDKVGLFPASFSLRKWVDKVVLFWGEGVSMLALCTVRFTGRCEQPLGTTCAMYVHCF